MDLYSQRRSGPLSSGRAASAPLPCTTARKVSQNPCAALLQEGGSLSHRVAQGQYCSRSGVLCGRRGACRCLDRDWCGPVGDSTSLRYESSGSQMCDFLGPVSLRLETGPKSAHAPLWREGIRFSEQRNVCWSGSVPEECWSGWQSGHSSLGGIGVCRTEPRLCILPGERAQSCADSPVDHRARDDETV